MNKEFRLHIAIVQHLRSSFPHVGFFHPTNEQKDATSAYFGKVMGVRPGTSDLVLGWAGRNIGALEIKTEEGRISTAQNKFLSWADSVGWSTGVARSVRGAHNILCAWGVKPILEGEYTHFREPDYLTKSEKHALVHDMYKPISSPKPDDPTS